MCAKVIASQRWDVFETRCSFSMNYDAENLGKTQLGHPPPTEAPNAGGVD